MRAVVVLLFLAVGCSPYSFEWIEAPEVFELAGPRPDTRVIDEDRPPRPPPVDPPVVPSLRIATFNLEVFGRSKASRPALVAEVASIITRYELVAVQEIKDISGNAAVVLGDAVTVANPSYRMLLSVRSGLQEDDRSSQEQYAYFYDSTRIAAIGDGVVFDDSTLDEFQREPYVARFGVVGTDLELVLANIHTRPAAAVEEIAALANVVDWIAPRYPGAQGVVVLGDYNAGCSYASPEELDAMRLRGDGFVWLIPDEADTNVASSVCAYDRMVTTAGLASAFTAEWGVDEGFVDPDVSDHWPVWVTLDPAAAPPR